MSFDKHSNFNKLANFSEVKFGENMPVLEVELNEMQQIQNEARADIIRDTMPSGFVTLGEIDYDYCKNNSNQIKLKSESIAYVNGYRITIPKDTIIEIGESDVDKEREDLVFLEVWKEAVNDIDTLTEYGGENNSVINNPIKDERYPIATSQRVQLKYRIRHVADVDFETNYEGLEYQALPNGTNSPSKAKPQGGNKEPLNETSYNLNFFRGNLIPPKNSEVPNRKQFSTDKGLYVAGVGDVEPYKTKLNTLDGYVYAIPMFRLKRKPNVGLASPFEYKKIHNQLDLKKFAHLVGQENVEKVHSVNVKGSTYANVDSYTSAIDFYTPHNIDSVSEDGYIQMTANGNYRNAFTRFNSNIKPNTKYLVIIDVKENTLNGQFKIFTSGTSSTGGVKNSALIFSDTTVIEKGSVGIFKYLVTTESDLSNTTVLLRNYINNNVTSGIIVYRTMMFEYQDGILDLDFTYFTGIKSLGESTNNSITVESNLVEDGTYVHELQNHILPTHPEVTHVTWGEDVVIPPEVEIELKNGEEVVQTITQLPVKLETTGEEKLHVKTMKGRTLVNLSPKRTYDFSCHGDDTDIYSVNSGVNEITLTINEYPNNWRYIYVPLNLKMLKPNTKYLVIFDGNFSGTFSIKCGNSSYPLEKESVHNSGKNSVVIETNDLSNGIRDQFLYLYPTAPSTFPHTYKVSNIRFIEYQEGMENWRLKYFEGMKSVEAPNIKVLDKNLFSTGQFNFPDKLYWNTTIESNNITSTCLKYDENNSGFGAGLTLKVKPNTEYILSYDHFVDGIYTRETSIYIYKNDYLWGTHYLMAGTLNTKELRFTTDSDTQFITIGFNYTRKTKAGSVWECKNVCLVEAMDYTENYIFNEPKKFKTPKGTVLRSLPNGNSDTLTFNTGTCNNTVKELRLLNMGVSGSFSTDTHTTYILGLTDAIGGTNIYCNSFIPGSAYSTDSHERITINTAGTQLALRVSNSRLGDLSMNEYLQLNPVFVQYGLSTPLNKKIGLSEDDYVGKSKVTYQLAEPLRKVGNYSDYIKGNTLYSNIGVEVLDGSEDWEAQNNTGNNHGFFLPHTKSIYKSPLISPQLPTLDGWEDYTRKGIFRGTEAIGLVVSADDLSENTLQGFKNWLRDNPVTIYYVKSNPSEIPLKEVSPLECDFSYTRQLKIGYENYLKELPNGVKDVLENGKVKRITNTITYTGKSSEEWKLMSSGVEVNTVGFVIELSNARPTQNINDENVIANLGSFNYNLWDTDLEGYSIFKSTSRLAIKVRRDKLTEVSVSGFKQMLNINPLHVIYELVTPVTEELTEDNSRYVSCMPLNSYVGSLYLANGINQTKFLTAFSPSEYEVQTYYHYFSNEFNVFEGIKRKKSPYGHETYLEEIDGKYVEKFIAGLEKHEIEDLRHKVSLTGFDYNQLLQDSFLKLIKGELS